MIGIGVFTSSGYWLSDLAPEQLLQLRLGNAHLVTGIHEIVPRTVQLGLRSKEFQLRRRTERITLLLHTKVFLRRFERRLQDRDSRLREPELSEILHELLLGEQLCVPQRGARVHLGDLCALYRLLTTQPVEDRDAHRQRKRFVLQRTTL